MYGLPTATRRSNSHLGGRRRRIGGATTPCVREVLAPRWSILATTRSGISRSPTSPDRMDAATPWKGTTQSYIYYSRVVIKCRKESTPRRFVASPERKAKDAAGLQRGSAFSNGLQHPPARPPTQSLQRRALTTSGAPATSPPSAMEPS